MTLPCVHRKNVLGFRIACEEMWGPDGLDQTVVRLPRAIRDATAGLIPLEEWIPEEFIIAWAHAVWEGPAQRSEVQFREYVAATIRHGFGRVKTFLLGMMTPESIAPRAQALWRGEHTTGTLTVDVVSPTMMRGRLEDHPYLESPILRMAIGEALRAAVAHTRARRVVESHTGGDPFVITLRYSAT